MCGDVLNATWLEYEFDLPQNSKVKLELASKHGFVSIQSLDPSKSYALFALPKRSLVNVAPLTVPSFPFPLSSFAFPQNGQ